MSARARPEPAARLRLFVAVEVPGEVRTTVHDALRGLRRSAPELRWVPPDRWHLTLSFLGDVAADRLPEVEGALARAAGRVGPFPLRLEGGLDRFGGRVLYVALAEEDRLVALAAAVRGELASRGLPSDDRSFRPHLTVARAPGRGRIGRTAGEAVTVPDATWVVERVVLVRSQLGRGGSTYTHLGRWDLGAS